MRHAITKYLTILLLAVAGDALMAAEPVSRVSVLASGKVLLDGKETSLGALDVALGKLKSASGVVWYYREGASGEPPPAAMQVVGLIIKHKLPISMSTKPDFSDVVGEDGQPRPRKP